MHDDPHLNREGFCCCKKTCCEILGREGNPCVCSDCRCRKWTKPKLAPETMFRAAPFFLRGVNAAKYQ